MTASSGRGKRNLGEDRLIILMGKERKKKKERKKERKKEKGECKRGRTRGLRGKRKTEGQGGNTSGD